MAESPSDPGVGGGLLRRRLVEAVVIVGSILLAFGIDAAWEARQDARAADDLLQALSVEFDGARAELLRHRNRWAEVVDATERLIVAQSTGAEPEPAVMDTLLYRFLTPTTFDAQDRALAGAAASGGLALIRDQELRNMLAAWPVYVAEVRDNELAGREFILRVLTPYLSEQEIPLGRSRALLAEVMRAERAPEAGGASGPDRWVAPLPSDEEARRAYARLLADPSFEPLLVTRYQWINVGEYDETIAFLDRLIARLDTALGGN